MDQKQPFQPLYVVNNNNVTSSVNSSKSTDFITRKEFEKFKTKITQDYTELLTKYQDLKDSLFQLSQHNDVKNELKEKEEVRKRCFRIYQSLNDGQDFLQAYTQKRPQSNWTPIERNIVIRYYRTQNKKKVSKKRKCSSRSPSRSSSPPPPLKSLSQSFQLQ